MKGNFKLPHLPHTHFSRRDCEWGGHVPPPPPCILIGISCFDHYNLRSHYFNFKNARVVGLQVFVTGKWTLWSYMCPAYRLCFCRYSYNYTTRHINICSCWIKPLIHSRYTSMSSIQWTCAASVETVFACAVYSAYTYWGAWYVLQIILIKCT
jgi:hypothetical protein